MRKTIVITSFHVFVSRNILAAPFFEYLKRDGWRVVIVVPEKKKVFFEQTYGSDNVFVFPVKNILNRFDDFFKDIGMAAIRTRSLAIMRRRAMGIERPLAQRLFFFAPLLRSFIPLLYRSVMPSGRFDELFEKFSPDVVFLTDVFSSTDCRLLLAAKRKKVPTVGMVRSWDNLTTKGGFRAVPDLLAIQNEVIKHEAVTLHGIPPKIIRVVGIPHYDSYAAHTPLASREQFLSRYDLERQARFVVYAPLGDRIVKVGDHVKPHSVDKDIVEVLDRVLPPGLFLLVRLPPTDTVNFEGLSVSRRVIVERPGTNFGEGIKGIRTSELAPADDRHLADTLFYSDAVITVFSSMCVDASVFDKPVVLVGFDPKPVSYWESIERLQEFDHIVPVIKTGGVTVAKNEKELREAILSALHSPAAQREGRERLVREQCFKLDGKGSERLYETIRFAAGL